MGYTNTKKTYVLSPKELVKGINTTEISAFHMENVQIKHKYGKMTDAQKNNQDSTFKECCKENVEVYVTICYHNNV